MAYYPSFFAPIVSGSYNQFRVPVPVNGAPALLLSGTNQFGRRSATIYNHSNASLFLALDQGVTGSAPTLFMVKLTSGSYYEFPSPVYQGPVYGVWDGNGGYAMVTEFNSDE